MNEDNAPPIELIPSFIRKANFHLLQLARPETVFFCRELPVAYVSTYLQRQEHFNTIRFLRHLMLAHFVAEYSQPFQACKWVIFTRTSGKNLYYTWLIFIGELLRLPSDARLKKLIVEPLKKYAEEYISEASLYIVSLSSIPSPAAIDDQVLKFMQNEEQTVMICIADMSDCTVSKVNYIRNRIDSAQQQDASKLILLILHYPSELNILNKSCYHAIFLNKWDYIYIDSLGVTTGIDEGKQVYTLYSLKRNRNRGK